MYLGKIGAVFLEDDAETGRHGDAANKMTRGKDDTREKNNTEIRT